MAKRFITIGTEETLTLHQLAVKVLIAISPANLPKFIAELDDLAEDWSTSKALIGHFKAVEKEYMLQHEEEIQAKKIDLK